MIFIFQFLQKTGDDIPAVHTADSVSAASILVSMYIDVHEVGHVLCYIRG